MPIISSPNLSGGFQPGPYNDLFFKTNNYKDFLNWSDSIRNSLSALNTTSPISNSVQSLLQFVSVSAISAAVKAFNQLSANQIDEEISDEIAANVANLADENAASASFLDAERKTYYDSKSGLPNGWDFNNPVPKDKRVNSNTLQAGYANSSFSDAGKDGTPTVKKVPFPLLGQEYKNHVSDITDRLNNMDTFEVFTGYKGVGSNSSNPKVQDYEFKSWVVPVGKSKENWIADPQRTFTPDRPYSTYIADILKKSANINPLPGSYKFFVEKLHGRYSDNSPYKMNSIKSQLEVTGDQNLSNRMVFYAYIDNYYDSYAPSWSSYNFLGRAEEVPAYKSTKRDITIEFTLLTDYNIEYLAAMEQLYQSLKVDTSNPGGATNTSGSSYSTDSILQTLLSKQGGLDWGLGVYKPPTINQEGNLVGANVAGQYSDTPEGLWNKMTFLSQCVYPYYREDGKMKEQPIIRLRVADFYDVTCYITNLQMQMNAFDGPMVDMNPSSIGNMPFGVKVTLSGTILHNYEPSSEFHGFYNRIEFDNKTKDPVTGLGINLQTNKVAAGMTKHSPIDFTSTFNNEKLLSTSKIDMGMTALQQNLGLFNSSFSQLNSVGQNLKTAFIKQQTKKSIEAFQAVSETLNYLRILYGVDPIQIQSPLDMTSMSDLSNTAASYGTNANSSTIPSNQKAAFQNVVNSNTSFKQLTGNTFDETQSADIVQPVITNDLLKVDTTVNNAVADVNNNMIKASQSPKTIQDILDANKSQNT